MILLTGASGFVGSAVHAEILKRSMFVRPAFREPRPAGCTRYTEENAVFIPSLGADTDWQPALVGVDRVIHCAAMAHVPNNLAFDVLDKLHEVNVDGTLNLAHQALKAGVKRFVFISSMGVNGSETFATPFTAEDVPIPRSAYALSKYEAEIGLKALAAHSNMEVVIIRPPLVYGPKAPGNFGTLMRLLERDIPLPFGAIRNKRSFVAIDNLVDLILNCASHCAAANEIFLASDGEDLSTTDLLIRMGSAMDRPVRLIAIPQALLKTCTALAGRSVLGQSLYGSLQVDIDKTRKLLDWSPPISVDEGLRRAVRKAV